MSDEHYIETNKMGITCIGANQTGIPLQHIETNKNYKMDINLHWD